MIRDQRHNQKANYRLFERFEISSSHRIEHQAQRDVRDDVVGEQNDDGSLLRVRWQRRQSDVESHTCCNWAEIDRRCLKVLAHGLSETIIHEQHEPTNYNKD